MDRISDVSAPSMAKRPDPMIGKRVQGRFEIVRRIAAGGMGVVYSAIQHPLEREVALKILDSHRSQMDPTFQKRFYLEAATVAKLAHPNTVVIYDYGETEDGLLFIAMELFEKGSLETRLRKHGPMTTVDATHVAMQIAGSLADAHGRGLVHRDLKPANVMFTERANDPLFAKVLDFGLVKVVEDGEKEQANLTLPGVMMGSPRYMAPEQIRAEGVDFRADIYALGGVLFAMLTGHPPFGRADTMASMRHHLYSDVPQLRAAFPECTAGPQLEAVVTRCLQKDPAHRYESMDEALAALVLAYEAEGGSLSGSRSSRLSSSMLQSQPDPSDSGHSLHRRTMRIDGASSAPSLPAITTPGLAGTPVEEEPARKPRSPFILLAIALLGIAVGLGVAAALLIPTGDPPPEILATSLDSPSESVPAGGETASDAPSDAPDEESLGTTAEETAVEPPAEPEPSEPEPAEPEPVAPEPAAMTTVTSEPAGATLTHDGEVLGVTPLEVEIPAGETWELQVAREGYEARDVRVAGGRPELLIHLEPSAPARRGRLRRRGARNRTGRGASGRGSRAGRGERFGIEMNDPWAQ